MAISREELRDGTPYRVTKSGYFNEGDILYLVYDDGSNCPKFNKNKDADRYHDRSYYVYLVELDKVHKFEVGDVVKRLYYHKILAVTDYGYVTTVRSNSVAEGYSLAPKETELTLQQIAKKFNIDVANLRIKE